MDVAFVQDVVNITLNGWAEGQNLCCISTVESHQRFTYTIPPSDIMSVTVCTFFVIDQYSVPHATCYLTLTPVSAVIISHHVAYAYSCAYPHQVSEKPGNNTNPNVSETSFKWHPEM